jgi:Acetamidase/Formamidase family
MCFVHSGSGLVQRATIGEAAATAFSSVAAGDWSVGAMDVAASGTPETVAGPGGAPVLDGYRRVLHNRWNRDLPPAAVVRPGQEIQLLCRDALDIGEAARTLTPEGTLTLDLGGVHPLTGPVEVEGAEPGDILEIEVLDVSPLVDFGYVVISPVLGLFGSLRPHVAAPLAQFTEASQLSDPTPGRAAGAIPADQPFNSGAPFVQLFHFERGQSSGFATFTGADTGKQAT